MLDRYAPGWRDLVLDRWVQRPSDLFAADANLVGGGVNGGTASCTSSCIFRPVTGLGGPRTRSTGSTSAAPRSIPVVGCTGRAGTSRPGRRCWTTSGGATRHGGHQAPPAPPRALTDGHPPRPAHNPDMSE